MLADQARRYCSTYDLRVLSEVDGKLEVEGDCYVWQGQSHQGTPVRSYQGRRVSLRQLLYKLLVDRNATVKLTTTCKNQRCLNPAHFTAWDGPGALGNARRKLSQADVEHIVAANYNRRGSAQRMAAHFNVTPSLISKIRKRKGR